MRVLAFVTLASLDCTEQDTLRSIEAVVQTGLRFVNRTSQKANVWWIDYDGKPEYWFTVNAGTS